MRRLLCLLDRHRVRRVVNMDVAECVNCPFRVSGYEMARAGPWHHLKSA